jgi:formylglycine-generating enzyme required for sulfatase activity
MGAQKTDPSGRNYDPQAIDDEMPVHEVELSPYFLSKYEMTQGQWERCTGRNPSAFGAYAGVVGGRSNLLHPVELVTWTQCMAVLSRMELTLPSEAQWENGCRCGTTTPWWTGSERESLRGMVNIAGKEATKAGTQWLQPNDWPDLEDEWVFHAPVGSFPANPCGLHEVSGNQLEWCQDGWNASGYGGGPEVDPVKPWEASGLRAVRGGGYYSVAAEVRSAWRAGVSPDGKLNVLGVRPARATLVPNPALDSR